MIALCKRSLLLWEDLLIALVFNPSKTFGAKGPSPAALSRGGLQWFYWVFCFSPLWPKTENLICPFFSCQESQKMMEAAAANSVQLKLGKTSTSDTPKQNSDR